MDRSSSSGTSWADQWDSGDATAPTSERKKSSSGAGGTVKSGVRKTNAVASSGFKKVKEGTAVGFRWIKGKVKSGVTKTKAAASSGFKKVKEGTAVGFRWIKGTVKRTQKH